VQATWTASTTRSSGLIALGATVAWEEQFPSEVAATCRNVVLRDVEGNEFCLGAGRVPSQRRRVESL
jgi:hypothetical protein